MTYGKTNWAPGNVSFVLFFIGPKIDTYIQERESIMATTTKFSHTNLANFLIGCAKIYLWILNKPNF
jgi:hypothetical protein